MTKEYFDPKDVGTAWAQIKREEARRQQQPTSLPERLARLPQTLVCHLFEGQWSKKDWTILGVATVGLIALFSFAGDESVGAPDKALEIQKAKVEGRLQLPPQYPEIQISQAPSIPVVEELKPTSADKLNFFQALIEETGLNVSESSFREIMAQLGVVIGPVEQFGNRVFPLKAAIEGVKIRRYPLSDEWDNKPPYGQIVVKYVDWGKDLPTYGFVKSLNQKTGKRLIFGITDWDVNPAPEENTAPNKFGDKLYRMGSYLFAWPNTDGTVGYSVEDPDPVLRQFAESKLQPKVSINLPLVQK